MYGREFTIALLIVGPFFGLVVPAVGEFGAENLSWYLASAWFGAFLSAWGISRTSLGREAEPEPG